MSRLTHGEKFLKRKKEYNPVPFLLAFLFIFLSALAIHTYAEPTMGQIQGLLTPEAHAAELHDLDAICAYAGLYPEKITNLKDLQVECANNGTPVQML